MLAKEICPYSSTKCGGKGQEFRFSTWGDSTKNALSVALSNGDSCAFTVNTQCGVPAFAVGDTTGFMIESVDYTDDEGSRRLLHAADEDVDVYDDESAFSVDLSFLDDRTAFQTVSNTTTNTTKTNTTSNTTTTNTTSSNTTNTTKTNTTTTNTTSGNTTTNTTKTNTTTSTNTTTTNTTTNTTKSNTTVPATPMTPMTPMSPMTPTPPPTPKPIKDLPNNFQVPRRTVTTSIINGTVVLSSPAAVSGPQAAVYRPDLDKGKRVFKGGARQGDSDYTCKSRNTRIFVTALGGLNVTVPTSIANATRILQSVPTTPTTPTYSLSLTVQSDYWSAGLLSRFTSFAFLAFASVVLLAF